SPTRSNRRPGRASGHWPPNDSAEPPNRRTPAPGSTLCSPKSPRRDRIRTSEMHRDDRITGNDRPDPPGLELLHAGAAAYQRGDPAEAARIFEAAARTGTDGVRVSALINAAAMYDELGDHHGSVTRHRAALTEIPADAAEKRASALINYSQALQHIGALD